MCLVCCGRTSSSPRRTLDGLLRCVYRGTSQGACGGRERNRRWWLGVVFVGLAAVLSSARGVVGVDMGPSSCRVGQRAVVESGGGEMRRRGGGSEGPSASLAEIARLCPRRSSYVSIPPGLFTDTVVTATDVSPSTIVDPNKCSHSRMALFSHRPTHSSMPLPDPPGKLYGHGTENWQKIQTALQAREQT